MGTRKDHTVQPKNKSLIKAVKDEKLTKKFSGETINRAYQEDSGYLGVFGPKSPRLSSQDWFAMQEQMPKSIAPP